MLCLADYHYGDTKDHMSRITLRCVSQRLAQSGCASGARQSVHRLAQSGCASGARQHVPHIRSKAACTQTGTVRLCIRSKAICTSTQTGTVRLCIRSKAVCTQTGKVRLCRCLWNPPPSEINGVVVESGSPVQQE